MAPLDEDIERELFGKARTKTPRFASKASVIVTIIISLSTFAMGFYSSSIQRDTTSEVRLTTLEGQIKDKASSQELQMLIDQQKETNKRLANIETILMNGALRTK